MPLYEALPILGAFCAVYLLPSIIAAFRRHHNTAAILALKCFARLDGTRLGGQLGLGGHRNKEAELISAA